MTRKQELLDVLDRAEEIYLRCVESGRHVDLVERKLESIYEELEDIRYIEQHGIDAFYGISERNFL